MKQKLLSSMLN